MRKLLAIVFALGLFGLIGWRIYAEKANAGEAGAQAAQRRNQTPSVEIFVAEKRDILETIEVVGNVESPSVSRLSPRVSGRLTDVLVREGDTVTAGQVLARMDPSETGALESQQRANVAEARARLTEAQLTTGANETGVQAAVKRSSAAVTRAEAELRQIRQTGVAEVDTATAALSEVQARLRAAKTEVDGALAQSRAAETQRDASKARTDRAASLFAEGFASKQQLEDAKAALASAQATLEVRQGEVRSARATVDSVEAQVRSAERRVAIARANAKADEIASAARLKEAQADLEEARANRAESPAYRANLTALRASVEAAEASLDQARVRREDLEIRAPTAGIVTERTLDPGSIASPGNAFLTVQSLDWLYVVASVPVERSGEVYVGQVVEMTLDGEAEPITGRLEKVTRAADVDSRQFKVAVRVQNPDDRLRPGMFAKLRIVVKRTSAPATVPLEAVATKEGNSTVMLLNDEDEANPQPVKVGASDQLGVAILSGIKPGDRVVVLSYQPVRDGQKVKVAATRDRAGKSTPVAAPPREGQGQGQGQGQGGRPR